MYSLELRLFVHFLPVSGKKDRIRALGIGFGNLDRRTVKVLLPDIKDWEFY